MKNNMFNGMFELIKLIFGFYYKCCELLILSIISALPMWVIYTYHFILKYKLPSINYIDFTCGIFIFLLILLLIQLTFTITKLNNNSDNKILLITASENNKDLFNNNDDNEKEVL